MLQTSWYTHLQADHSAYALTEAWYPLPFPLSTPEVKAPRLEDWLMLSRVILLAHKLGQKNATCRGHHYHHHHIRYHQHHHHHYHHHHHVL